jgi:hypothetical protein
MKITDTQVRALNKLTDKYQSAYQLQEKLNTLNSLVKLKLAQHITSRGSLFFPRTSNLYKKI